MTGIQRLAAGAAAALFLASSGATGAGAQTLCSAPIAPFCVQSDATFSDQGTTERCRQDVETFATQVDDYAACLDEMVAELRQEQEALRQSFACRADGGQDCPSANTLE